MSYQKDAIAQIINGQWDKVVERCNSYQLRILYAIKSCRTSVLGGELYRCNKCLSKHVRYNSCGNRHCPRCQSTNQLRWIQERQAQFLPTKYYHVVFTIPHELNELCLGHQRIMYSTMFACVWKTLEGFGWNQKYLGAQLGATMVLHTWGSDLSYHPHIHCIVPGGGVTLKNKWKPVKGNGKYLFPVMELAKVFRGKYLEAIEQAGIILTKSQNKAVYKQRWNIYAKPCFGNKDILIKYLARYTYKTAITHHRIKCFDNDKVTFSYTDYRHRNQRKTKSLKCSEFVRRFALHILPKSFIRVRHYGILHSSWKRKIFPKVEKQENDYKKLWEQKGILIDQCKTCKKGQLIFIEKINPSRGPPRLKYHDFQNSN